MDLLILVLTLILFIGTVVAYSRCERSAQSAQAFARTLEIRALELKNDIVRLDSLEARFEKLHGRFYRTLRKDDEPVSPVATEPVFTCENWVKAREEGPRSVAASCECEFCVGMRAARRAEKAAILATRPLVSATKRGE